jgi:membrane-bound ClpP family serine protease
VPLAVALLAHPAGAYVALVAAIAGLFYGAHVRRFVPLFAGVCAGVLALLGFLHVPPHGAALPLIAVGVALLTAEFRFGSVGAAGALGLAGAFAGSWLLLAPPAIEPLPPPWRALLALAGTLALALAVLAGWRRATLP